MSLRDAALVCACFVFIPTMASTACSSRRSAASSGAEPRDNPSMATINVRPGEDRQAKIVLFDGVPFDAFAAHYVKSGPYRIPVQPGLHEIRVVVPAPCTYYDGLPGPGPSLSTMRFSAKAGAEYEIAMVSFPSQILTVTMVHVFELLEAPNQVRIVEETISSEPAPASCANERRIVP